MAPPVEFDTTLQELYALNGDGEEDTILAYVPAVSQVQLVQGMPVCRRWAYQDRLPPSSEMSPPLARTLAQVLPQSHAIIAGKMKLVMLDLDIPGNAQLIERGRADTEKVFGAVAEAQRPIASYVRRMSDLDLPAGACIAVSRPADCLDHLKASVLFESHYRAHSKRELALSTVPTAPSVVIDAELDADSAQDPECRAREAARMIEFIEKRPLPFVVKLPQAHAGLGTFIVRTEEDRIKTLEVLRPEVNNMIGMISPANIHMHPASFVLQEMLPGTVTALCIFLPKSGEPIITSVTKQSTDDAGRWTRALIDYSQQDRLAQEYKGIVDAMGQHLRSIGYHGPAGADVMTDANGQHAVVDLNARVSGSHPLGFLKRYWSVTRGLNHASIIAPPLRLSLDEFRDQFATEMDEGRIVIFGWSDGGAGESSIPVIAVAGKDVTALDALEEKIKELSPAGERILE